MKDIKSGTIVLLILCFVASCSPPDEMDLDEFKRHLADESNGLLKRLTKGGYRIDVMIQPTDLLVHRELKRSLPALDLENLRDKYGRSLYILISISKDGKEALRFQNLSSNYSQILHTMSFGMNAHVEVITSSGTIRPSDYIMDRTYGLGAASNFLFAFDRSELVGTDWLDISLKEFGLGIGNQMVRFKTEDLKNLPRLRFPLLSSSNHLNDF